MLQEKSNVKGNMNHNQVIKFDDQTDLVENKYEELQEYVLKNYGRLEEEMETFFKGQHSDILIQWKANF